MARAKAGPKTPTARAVAMTDEAKVKAAWAKSTAGDGLMNVVAGLGTPRDKSFYSEYGPTCPKNQIELEFMFTGSAMARRIVSTIAEEMTREWLELSWDGSDKDLDGPRAITAYETKLGVRAKVTEAIRWARLFGGAGIVMGIKGQDDLSQPLDTNTIGKDSLRYLRVYSRYQLVGTGDIDFDIKSDNYNLPLSYTVVGFGAESSSTVHWTRVIRFDGDPLPWMAWLQNARWGASVLQTAFEAVRRYDGVTGGIASMIWETNVDIIKVKNFFELLTQDNGAQITDRFQKAAIMKSFNRLILMDADEEYQQKKMEFSGLKDLLLEFRTELCAVADVPMTRLFGTSPGGLGSNGDGELTNFYDHIGARQESDLRPQVTRLYDVLVPSAIEKKPPNMSIEFNPLWQMTDIERAKIEKENAERDHINWSDGFAPASVIAKQIQERRTYGSNFTDEDIKLIEEIEKQPQPLTPVQKDPPAGTNPPAGISREPGLEAEQQKSVDALDAKTIRDMIKHESGGWSVYNAEGTKRLSGPYASKKEAITRLGKIEYFKAHDANKNKNPEAVVERREIQGFKIAIENPAGSTRRWFDENSKETGTVTMKFAYGFFEDFVGSDNEELDCYIGPNENALDVYIVKQLRKPDYLRHDEDKIFLQFAGPAEAIAAYLAHRDDGSKAFGGLSALPLETFRKKLHRRVGTGPIRT